MATHIIVTGVIHLSRMVRLIVNKLTVKAIMAVKGIERAVCENLQNTSKNNGKTAFQPVSQWSKATVC